MTDEKLSLEKRTRLNLGSGRLYDPLSVNVDLTSATNPDVVHNLEVLPWPFPENRFEYVEMRDVLEHLEDTLAVIEEIHRIVRPGGRVLIVVPHFSSNGAFADPTHKRFFSAGTFEYFTDRHPNNFYTTVRFNILESRIVFRPKWRNKICWRLANRFPKAYEESWAWMFPAWFLSVLLDVQKR